MDGIDATTLRLLILASTIAGTVTALCGAAAAIASLMVSRRNRATLATAATAMQDNSKAVEGIRISIDGRLEELLELTRRERFAAGAAEEKQKQLQAGDV